MKDLVQIWNRVTGNQYSSNSDREMRDFSNNRLKRNEHDNGAFDNFSECEGLNKKHDNKSLTCKRNAIFNRLFERKGHGQYARRPKCLFMLLMFGFFAIGAGCFMLIARPYDFFFRMKVQLTNGGEIFEMWRKPEVDLYCRIFLFNITNAEAYMAGKDDKIRVEEIGPYVYKESLEHEVKEFNPNATLSAIPKHPLSWVPELSEGRSEDDMLYLPNIALLSIANVVAPQNYFTRLGLNNLISMTNSKALAKMTAKEFMMGYESRLMTLGHTFMPGWISFDKLGLIDRMYDFAGDYETIFTGTDDVSISGLIDTYRGSIDLPQWKGEHCSRVQYASDGTKFKGGIGRNESLLFYRKSMCRAAPLVPKEEGVKSNLNALMYTFPEHMMDNGKHIAENKCFCRNDKCLPEGLIDVTECYYGFPIALSYPHFYQGDEVLFNKVEGLTPNRELHETRFWIQPDSGLPLDVSTKMQINMALEDISNIKNAEKFANMYLPLLWFDIRMYALPPSLQERFNLYLNVLPAVVEGVMYFFFISGAIFIIVTVYRLSFKVIFKPEKPDNKEWIDKEKGVMKDAVYTPCEVPLDTDADEPLFEVQRRPPMLKTHSSRLLELSHRLSDKVYDSVGSMKGKVREFTHVKNIFNLERRDSLIPRDDSSDKSDEDRYGNVKHVTNEAFKSDSSDNETDYHGKYKAVKQSDSDDDDCKYLEVLDDGSGFDDDKVQQNTSNRASTLERLDQTADDLILYISD